MPYMMYKTRLTSKGTTTIPVEIRKKLGIEPGMYVSFEQNQAGDYVLKRERTIEEIRAMNKAAMKREGTLDKEYTRGAGFEAYIEDKYGG